MKRFFTLFIAFLLVFNFTAKADEGMWLLTLLNKNYSQMKALGFKLTPEDIYSINKGSLKDAIVQFGQNGRGFCTGEVISSKGLLLTNHHCGYGSIQHHSTVEHDYLADGFWAKTMEDELYTPGQMVKFLETIEDVTVKATEGLNDKMTEQERRTKLRENITAIEKAAMEGKGKLFEAVVMSFFGGNHFYLVRYNIYNDVRMVGAPPSSIGKFGHDTDNWVWPRHTGDFSMFRVYMGKDGQAAEYSKENVPLAPKHHLPVSIKGVKKGDFAMVMGYPGRTFRFMTSFEIDELLKITHPNRIKIRGIRQEIMMKDMKSDAKVNIQYSSKYSGSSNYWKNSIGQKRGLERLKVADQKLALQKDFLVWANADAARKEKYGEALNLIENAIKGRAEYQGVSQILGESLIGGIEMVGMAGSTLGLVDLLADKDKNADAIAKTVQGIKGRAEGFYKDYNMPTDKKLALAMLDLFMKDVDSKYHPDFYQILANQYNNSIPAMVDELYSKSIFVSAESLNAFLENPTKEALENDLAFKMIKSCRTLAMDLNGKLGAFNDNLVRGQRLLIAGLLEMNPTKNYAPDANFTMRLTYGTVGDYKPADAVHYDYMTYLDGIMEKYVPGDYEFDAPAKLIELYNKKDFGQYADKNGKMPVCFTTNNDITGGNSGSPVMDAKGNLIGLAFDGNWEAMSGDIAFENQLQKCINMDARYLLFIIEKFAGANRLIEEMTIVK